VKNKGQRKQEAAARQAARDKRTAHGQIILARSRRGLSTKEIERLLVK
jgi:hypothetical protein